MSLTGKGFDKVNSYDIYLENDKGASATPVLKSKMPESMVFTVPNMPAGIYRLYIVGRDGNSNTVNLTITSVNGANASAAWEWVSSLFK